MEDSGGIELTSLREFCDEVSSPEPGNDGDSESELIASVRVKKEEDGNKIKSTLTRFRSKLKGSDSTGIADADDSGLKKELSLFSAVAYLVGTVIGSGIFITPRTVLCRTGSFGTSLIVWVIGGIAAMAGGLCYIELGLLVRKSGAEYSFIKEAYSFKRKYKGFEILGSLLSFLYIWCSVFVIRSSSLAVITLTCAQYLIRPFYIGCNSNVSNSAVKLVSLAILVLLALINCYSLKLASKVMSVFSVTKVLAILFIVAIGLIFIIKEQTFPSSFTNPFETLPGQEPTVSSIGLSLYSVLWTYDGWNIVCCGTEETKNLKRNLPLSVLIGVPIVITCYLLANVSFFAVLEYEEILDSEAAIALPFGNMTIGIAGLVIIPLLVSVSTFGSANGTVYTGSRIAFVAAREGHLPDFLSGTHTTAKTPIPTIVAQIIIAMLMVVIGTIDQLIDGLTFALFVFYGKAIVAVMILRITHREKPHFFKLWFILPVAITMSLFCLFVVSAPLLSAPIPPLIALVFILLGIPVYFFLVMNSPWKLRPKVLDTFSSHIAQIVNNLFNTQSTREPMT